MSNKELLQEAKQLIAAKRYADARTILLTLNDVTARKWLARLDEIAPEIDYLESESQPVHRMSNAVILASLSVMLLITFLMAFYGAFLRPTGTVEAEVQDLTQAWEYLNFHYGQADADRDGKRQEWGYTDDPLYDITLFGEPSECDEFDEDCAEKEFMGSFYYLNAIGAEGWELTSLIDKSTQYIYSLEMIFKRPKKS